MQGDDCLADRFESKNALFQDGIECVNDAGHQAGDYAHQLPIFC
jgi:hypothetical protein